MKKPIDKKIDFETGTTYIEWNSNFVPRIEGDYSKAQMYLDKRVLQDCAEFLPFRQGILEKSGLLGTEIGSGILQWTAPYTRYLYYGKVMIGPAPKEVTDIPLVYDKSAHTQAGPMWFEEAKKVYKDRWITNTALVAMGKG